MARQYLPARHQPSPFLDSAVHWSVPSSGDSTLVTPPVPPIASLLDPTRERESRPETPFRGRHPQTRCRYRDSRADPCSHDRDVDTRPFRVGRGWTMAPRATQWPQLSGRRGGRTEPLTRIVDSMTVRRRLRYAPAGRTTRPEPPQLRSRRRCSHRLSPRREARRVGGARGLGRLARLPRPSASPRSAPRSRPGKLKPADGPGGDALGVRADGRQPDQHGRRLARPGLGHRGAELPPHPRRQQAASRGSRRPTGSRSSRTPTATARPTR